MKRIISLFLCVILLFSSIPMANAAKYSDWFKGEYTEMTNALQIVPVEFQNMDLTQLISRQEVCDFLVPMLEKLTGNHIEPTKTDYFTDTKNSNIIKAHELGIINGYTDGTFLPGKGISRQEMFQVLVNFCNAAGYAPKVPGNINIYSYTDGKGVAEWAKNATLICLQHGYVQGDSNKALKPQSSITRQEAMAMFSRCYKGLLEYYLNVVTASFSVTANTLNIRSEASENGKVMGTLPSGTVVSVNSMGNNKWYRFLYNGNVCYISSDYLEPYSGKVPVAGSGYISEKANTIVNHALQYLGYAYVYGGKSPSSGFDCSGLVYYVFGQNGISMNRVADDQMNQGTPVSKENLAVGDLLFWGYGDYADHVGIYIGNGNFIHASNPRSGVKISTMNETYYARKYIGARRIIPA